VLQSLSDPLYSDELAKLEADSRKRRADPSADARDVRRARRAAAEIEAGATEATGDAVVAADKDTARTTTTTCAFPTHSHSNRPATPSPVAWRCGSTLVCALVDHASSSLIIGHVGDARAVLSAQGGIALRLSEDHRPQRPDEVTGSGMEEAEVPRKAASNFDDVID